MDRKIGIVKIKNPFNKLDRTTSLVDYSGESLLEVRNKHFPTDIDVITSLNGKVIAKHDLEHIYLVPNDYVLFIPAIEGDDILPVLAMVALVIVAIVAPYGLAAAGIISSATAAGLGGTLISAGIMMVGGILINSFLAPTTPFIETPTISGSSLTSGGLDDSSASQTYSWNPQTTQQQGLIIPKIYGTMKATGNIIAAYIENISDSQYLNVLINLGYGPIRSIYTFKISDQLSSSFNSINIETRRGLIDQSVISNFNDTKVEYSLSRKVVYGTPIEYTTIGDNFDALEVDITFPNGLYYSNDQGGLDAISESFYVQVANLNAPSTWYCLTNTPTAYSYIEYVGQWRQGYWSLRFTDGETAGETIWMDTGAPGSSNYNDHYEGEKVSDVAAFMTYYYDNTNGSWTYSFWHWCGDVITKYATALSSATIVTGAQTNTIRRTYRIDGLQAGQYKVMVAKNTPEYNSSRYGEDMYLSAVREIHVDDFQYPKHVLVGIKALATDQLSGSFDFSCMIDGSLVRVYRPDEVTGSDGYNYRCIQSHVATVDTQPITGTNWATYWKQEGHSAVLLGTTFTVGTVYSNLSSWHTEFSNNPAWVCYDVLSQPIIKDDLTIERYDGIDPSRLDTTSFRAWADFCDELVTQGGITERRITFNGTFDSGAALWEAANKVCQMSRAVLLWNGITIKVIMDEPSTPIQMFSVGNMVADSFKETFLSLEERASELEISFINSEKGYEKDTLNIFNKDIDTNNKVSVDLVGVTKSSEVWRDGMYRLYNNQYLTRTIEFDAEVDAVACTVGDLIYVQHDVPSWSDGGRVVSATLNTVTLDKEILISEGNTYVVKIRLSDGTLVDKTITDTSGTLSTFNLSSSFDTLPDHDNVYIFGIQNNAKPFRVTGISYTSDLKYSIKAVEYNASIYNCDTDTPAYPTADYSTLETVPQVLSLTAAERLEKIRGNIEVVIDVSFKKPLSSFFKEAQIWYMDSQNTTWRYAGTSSTGYFKISGGITELVTYTIKAVSRNTLNVCEKFEDGLTTTVFISGKSTKPSDVTNFWSQGSIGGLILGWEDIADLDLKYYKLRYSTNTDDTWENSIDLAVIRGTTITLPAAQDGIYFIKAIDTSNNESDTAASLITTIPSILNWKLLETVDESVNEFNGMTLSTVGSSGGVYLDSSAYVYVQNLLDDVINLDTIQDFDLLDSYYAISGVTSSVIYTGYYESLTTLSFTEVYDARCSAELTFIGVDSANLFDDVWDFDAIVDFDGEVISGVGVQPQIALSQDGVTWNEDRVEGTDSNYYKCKKTHRSNSTNKPITGGDYLNYWELLTTWTTIGTTWETDILYDDADYQNFLIGDFKAMAYKFRLKMYTNNTTKYPLVTDLAFYADAPERSESEQDITCYSTGIHKVFTKPYFYKPKIGVTIQNAQEGDYYNLEGIDLVGFTLTIKNTGVGVDRTIDWEVRGY